MDLRFTPADDAFRAHVRAWLRDNLPAKRPTTLDAKKAWHRQLYAAGFVGMGWPRQYGGYEARPMEQAIVAEEMARVNAPASINYMGINVCGPAIWKHGTEAQKERFIPKILAAEEMWCQLFSEPNAGSDLASLQCRADIDGDEFVVSGQKIWTSSATHADWGFLLVRTDRDAPKHQGISALLVDMCSPGVEARPLTQISGSQEFSEVFFNDVRVPADNLLGELNAGWRVGQTALDYERGGDLMGTVTRLQTQFSRLVTAAETMRHDGARAIDDPLVRQQLGAFYAEVEVLRYAGLRVLSGLEHGRPLGPEASLSKLHYTELDKRLQEVALDILGPWGQMTEGLPEWLDPGLVSEEELPASWPLVFLYARAGTIYAGSSEIQKNIIGERVLGLPKEARADRLARA